MFVCGMKSLLLVILHLISVLRAKKVCTGLRDPDYVNYSNYNRFRGCTKIVGNIIIVDATFSGDLYRNFMGLHPDALEVFSSVESITGFLVIQGEHRDFKNLSYFRNLVKIGGRSTIFGGTSLSVVTTSIESIGMTSLKTVRRGHIMFAYNKKLCYVDSIDFKSIIRRKSQRIIIKKNQSPKICELGNMYCDDRCSKRGCWGPGVSECVESPAESNSVMAYFR